MREHRPYGDYKGVTLYYNDVIITVSDPDWPSLTYKCHLQNYNKSIYLSHGEIESVLDLQRLIKEETR